VTYHPIATGKLRRYFDWNNFKDPFKVMLGTLQAFSIIKKTKPNVIFSKGGFVSVPVIVAAKMNRTPSIIHESDLTPGLANKVSIPFATKVCVTFPETRNHIGNEKAVHVGPVVRKELKEGAAVKGRKLCGFSSEKPVLFIMGGSLGAKRINAGIRENLNKLISQFDIIHICGKGQKDESINVKGYQQYEYVSEELPDLMAAADIVISRAGSNSIFEFLALRKPMLLIPLSRHASRGDQILNAKSFQKSGFCEVLEEESLTNETLLNGISNVYEKRKQLIENMNQSSEQDSLTTVVNLIKQAAKN
jgi:UDP-N-acetylglucosamine--N-acetylmuramyl-(pentapeptide) pyrophosphoryl-undecaprenol N-acetylglucosamine transferase